MTSKAMFERRRLLQFFTLAFALPAAVLAGCTASKDGAPPRRRSGGGNRGHERGGGGGIGKN
jgi:hypothetical protein